MAEGDPLAWIRSECIVSRSQDEILRNAPYAHPNCGSDSDAVDDEAEMGSEEMVVMVSLSESSSEGSADDEMEEEEEEYRTPPEQHSHSLASSNEATMGAWAGEDGGENAVDLSRDLEMDSCDFRADKFRMGEDSMVMEGECRDRAVRVSEGMIPDGCFVDAADTHRFGSKLTEGEEIEGRQEGTVVSEGAKLSAEIMVMDEDVMEGVEVPPSGCGGVTGGAEMVVQGNQKSSVDAEIVRIVCDTEFGVGKSSRGVEASQVNELQFKSKNAVGGVEMIRCAATSLSFSGNDSSEKHGRVPSSVFNGSKAKADSGVGIGQDGSGVRTHQGDGIAGDGKADGGSKATKGDRGPRAVKGAGKKASEPSNKELSDDFLNALYSIVKGDEQRENSGLEERFDIVQAAINAGVSFPRPSWRSENSDNDSD